MITREYATAIELIRHPERMDRSTVALLREALKQYPFYQTLHLLLLQNMYKVHDPEFGAQLKRSAVMIADRSVLFDMIEGDNFAIPVQPIDDGSQSADGIDRTLSLIDNFLKAQPDTTDSHSSTPSSSEPVDPSVDYSAYLEQLPDYDEGPSVLPSPVLSLVSTSVSASNDAVSASSVVIPAPDSADIASTDMDSNASVATPQSPLAPSQMSVGVCTSNPSSEPSSHSSSTPSPFPSSSSVLTDINEDEFTVSAIRQRLAADDAPTPHEDVEENLNNAHSRDYFTETMASFYIKQQKYEQALEIIKGLSIDNPKKNAYFADQIRYLELLIRINKNKK